MECGISFKCTINELPEAHSHKAACVTRSALYIHVVSQSPAVYGRYGLHYTLRVHKGIYCISPNYN